MRDVMGPARALFRGKRADTGEWAEGFFCGGNERGTLHPGIFTYETETQSYRYYDIEIDTLGQCTGLRDKNGTSIFEGDIVRYADSINQVVFEQRNGTAYFGIRISENETWYFCGAVQASKMEVIGNIHDNPDM